MDTKTRLNSIVDKALSKNKTDFVVYNTDNKTIPCPFSKRIGLVRVELSSQQITADNTSKSIEIQWYSPKQTRVERLAVRHNIVGKWENTVFLEAGKLLECEAADDAQYEFDHSLFDKIESLIG